MSIERPLSFSWVFVDNDVVIIIRFHFINKKKTRKISTCALETSSMSVSKKNQIKIN